MWVLFGALPKKKLLLPEQLITFETELRYQMYHALFLILITAEMMEKTKLSII
jgi:uncharacterized membrane protein YgdD (TMEM256/DUF423 family)